MAAEGLSRDLLPARNRRDFDDTRFARNKLEFVWLERVDDASAEALENKSLPSVLRHNNADGCERSRGKLI